MSYSSSRLRRQSFISWPVCLALISLISTIGFCKPTGSADFTDDGFPSTFASSSSSLSSLSLPPQQQPQRKTLDQEYGSPSELAWRAWLLVESKGGGQAALDSSNILRRITPKSIFIAPEIVTCQTGYSPDGKNGCKLDPINIDEDAQRQFLLKRLNNFFGKNGNGNRKKPSESGPLQINIPFALPGKTNPQLSVPQYQQSQQPPVQRPALEQITNDRLEIPIVISQQTSTQSENNKNQKGVAVVVYKVNNYTKKEETIDGERITFSPGSSISSSSQKETTQSGHMVPIAEIVDGANDTYIGIVDYKIPLGSKTAFNQSNVFDQTKIDSTRRPNDKKVDTPDLTEDSSPTVVLLLSPTKAPMTATPLRDYELPRIDRFTTRQEPDQRENATVTESAEETRFESDTTIQSVSPLDMETSVDQTGVTILTSTEKAYTDDRLEEDTAYTDDDTQTEPISEDHDEYDNTTEEVVDQDDFSESEDELLKPGEAGMMIPAKNQDLVKKNHKHHMPTTVDLEEMTSTTLIETTTMPPTPSIDVFSTMAASDSTIKSDPTAYTKGEVMSTVMTDIPTIMTTESNADDITTISTKPFRPESLLMSTTRAHPTQIPTTTVVENRDKTNVKEETLQIDKDIVTEPEVIFATQGSGHGVTTSNGRKRPIHPSKVIEIPRPVDHELEASVSKTVIPFFTDSLRQPDYKGPKPPITIISNEPHLYKNDGNIPSEFKDQILETRPAFTDFRRIPTVNDESYVRFPEQQRVPERRPQQTGYVRFPSDEVNSIHNQDTYKDLLLPYRPRDNYNSNSPTSTKSSVPARQKQPLSQWRVPHPRMDRQQQQQLQSSSQRQQQKQKPMLLRFWARMPLVRDLSFYPTTSHGSHNEPIGGTNDSHRLNSRFSQQSLTTASARQVNYYKEVSTHDVNRLLAQQLAQPAIGG